MKSNGLLKVIQGHPELLGAFNTAQSKSVKIYYFVSFPLVQKLYRNISNSSLYLEIMK